MYIPRKLEDAILKQVDSKEIIAVIGPRQCGKTTLLEHIYNKMKEQSVFFSFEDKKLLDLFVHDIDGFINLYIKPYRHIFIDEFQYAKRGGKHLKYIFDSEWRKIFISGSSSIDLAVQTVKYLVGRVFVFSLFPLDFEEFLSFSDPKICSLYKKNKIDLKKGGAEGKNILTAGATKRLSSLYEEYVVYGGYPRVITSSDIETKKMVLKNIYNTYFLREVKDILGLVDDYKLAQMIKALSLQVGNLIEYNEISKVSELSYQTVKGYLNFLQKTFICDFPKPFFKNKRTEIVKNPKVYFFDAGLRNYVIDDFRAIGKRPDGGALLENGLTMQLQKEEIPFHFWRTKNQSEIDFVLDLPDSRKVAIEVKKKADQSDLSSRSFKEFEGKYKEIPLLLASFEWEQALFGKSVFLPLL